MTWVLDLDGVVWRGDEVIAGSVKAIDALQESGQRIIYATNSSFQTSSGFVDKLAEFGITAHEQDIVHGGHAVAKIVEPGTRILSCAGPGVAEALDGLTEVIDVSEFNFASDAVDAVVVGLRFDFEFSWFTRLIRAVLDNAQLIAPSGDPLYPIPRGFMIGGGSLAHAVGYATGKTVEVAGKPNAPIADVVRQRAFDEIAIVVGDQARTDGRLAQHLGVPFALVQSGVTQSGGRNGDDAVEVPIAHTELDLLSLVNKLL